jgi:hypothetical protein
MPLRNMVNASVKSLLLALASLARRAGGHNTTLMATITRKEAEAAKARARAICNDTSDPAWHDTERRACVAIWNEFCAQEAQRLARASTRAGIFSVSPVSEIYRAIWGG